MGLPKWLQKSIVALITVLTFGIVTPTDWFNDIQPIDEKTGKRNVVEPEEKEIVIEQPKIIIHEEKLSEEEKYFNSLMAKVKEESFHKFGHKIGPVIEKEFNEVILPKMEEAIKEVALRDDERIRQLEIMEGSTGGETERIFHLGDRLTKEEIIRFHVRRDHPPQAGYWFNFHYHTYHDGFVEHFDLGSLYWDKNTPPHWMT